MGVKAVYATDYRFVCDDDQVLSAGSFPQQVWTRFLDVFDSVSVVARKRDLPRGKRPSDFCIASRKRVKFRFVASLGGVWNQVRNRSDVKAIVDDEVENASVVIARLPSEIGLLACQSANRKKKTWAVEVAGCAWDALWNYGELRAKLYAPVMYWRTRRAVGEAPFALYVTEGFLQRRYPCADGITIGCSNVELASQDRRVLYGRLNRIHADKRPLVFGLIGTLKTRYKGIQTALAAFSRVRDRLPEFEFRVLGQGDPEPWRQEARDYGVRDIVRFEGTLPSGDAIFEWLDEVDIYLQPSLQEGLPRALVEAMSRGCPCMGSSVAGIPELLADDAMHPPKDEVALSRLLVKGVDSGWRRLQAERNWKRALDFAPNVLERRRRGFWRKVAKHAAR